MRTVEVVTRRAAGPAGSGNGSDGGNGTGGQPVGGTIASTGPERGTHAGAVGAHPTCAPIRLLLVADRTAFREALALALGREPDLVAVSQAGTLAEARERLRNVEVDVAVVDLDLPDGDGADLIRDLRAGRPLVQVLVLTGSPGHDGLARAVAAGAAGALSKSAPLADIVAAVRRLCAGQPAMPPAELVALLRLAGERRERDQAARQALARLTRRECEVLAALADGLGDREIAARLAVSTETVRTHMVNLLGKLGAESRLRALVFAVKHGAVRID